MTDKFQTAFFAVATLVPNRNGVYVFPATRQHLKPVVMAARLMERFEAPEEMRPGVTASMANRFELFDVKLHEEQDPDCPEGVMRAVVVAEIREPGRDPVVFEDTYRNAVVILGESND